MTKHDGLTKGWTRDQMAARAAQELQDGFYVNLGIGIPTLVANHVPAGMTVTLATMAVIFGTAPQVNGVPQLSGVEGPVALIAANLFVVAFGMSWGPVVWVLLGEMFPNRIRAAALGLAAAGQWVANWAITVTFPELRSMLGVAYGFYALCALLSLVFVAKWVRETKGVALEDMHAELLA